MSPGKYLFLCVDPRIPVTSRMPGQDDDYLRRMAAAMDRLFFGRCIDELKSSVWAIAGEDEHGAQPDLLDTIPMLLSECSPPRGGRVI